MTGLNKERKIGHVPVYLTCWSIARPNCVIESLLGFVYGGTYSIKASILGMIKLFEGILPIGLTTQSSGVPFSSGKDVSGNCPY